jgi:hypothetical protein
MGVLFDIYCIPQEPSSVRWSTILDGLLGGGFVRPPFWVGHPLRTIASTSYLRSPELASMGTLVSGEADSPRELAELDEACRQLPHQEAAMLAVEALAWSLRREPQNFHPASSHLGLYRFPRGHTLTVGEPADPAWQAAATAVKWRGTVSEFLWIEGKNAPLAEDFEGSPLHLALTKLWPGCLVLADERL